MRGANIIVIYGRWIYNYLCNQCLSPVRLWIWIPLRWGVLDTTLCDKDCQWFSPVSSTNKTDHHDITEILLKVALNTINLTHNMRNLIILKIMVSFKPNLLFFKWLGTFVERHIFFSFKCRRKMFTLFMQTKLLELTNQKYSWKLDVITYVFYICEFYLSS